MRAVCITLVMMGHLVGTQGFPVSSYWYHTLFPSAHLGVKIFFVVSGFLITHLLMREEQKYGSVLLRRFFFRRIFRIVPAFYGYVACLALFAALGWVALQRGDLLHAATFTMNYHWIRGWELGHIWSLSVEEQFYLLWPSTMALLGTRAGIRVAGACVLLGPVLRVGVWYFFPDARDGIGESFESVADNLAIGCVMAAGRDWLWTNERYRRFMLSPWFVIVPALVLVSDHMEGFPSWGFPIGHSFENVGLALCVEWCLRNFPARRIPRFLNYKIMVAAGRISYSLYLWQQLFLNRNSDSVWCAFPQNLLLAYATATVSYWVLERPFMKMRPHIENRFNIFRSVTVARKDPATTGVGKTHHPA